MADLNKPGRYSVYKKSAAAQISLILPTHDEKGWLVREGAVMIEATRSTGTDDAGNISYNWDKGTKISFALGMNDLALLLDNIETKLVHDHQGAIKNLQIKSGEGRYEGTYTMSLYQKDTDGSSRNVMVPLTAGEMAIFGRLLDRATSKIIGW